MVEHLTMEVKIRGSIPTRIIFFFFLFVSFFFKCISPRQLSENNEKEIGKKKEMEMDKKIQRHKTMPDLITIVGNNSVKKKSINWLGREPN